MFFVCGLFYAVKPGPAYHIASVTYRFANRIYLGLYKDGMERGRRDRKQSVFPVIVT